MQLAKNAKRSELHPDYAEIGAKHEELHAEAHPEATREVPFKREVSDTAILSGRADFVFDDHIDECKASFSKKTIDNAKAGKPEVSHLSQLVCYLLEFGKSRGRIIYGYFERNKAGKLVRKAEARVEVKINPDGSILVNDLQTPYKANELVNSIQQIDKWMHTEMLAPRPASEGFMGACRWCPLNELCHRAEVEHLTVPDIEKEAVELIEAKKSPIPKIVKEK